MYVSRGPSSRPALVNLLHIGPVIITTCETGQDSVHRGYKTCPDHGDRLGGYDLHQAGRVSREPKVTISGMLAPAELTAYPP